MKIYKSKSKKQGNEKRWLARQPFRFGWIYWTGDAEDRADAGRQAKVYFERKIADKAYDKCCLPGSPWLKDRADWTAEEVKRMDALMAESQV